MELIDGAQQEYFSCETETIVLAETILAPSNLTAKNLFPLFRAPSNFGRHHRLAHPS
jgi:hypothetical protein